MNLELPVVVYGNGDMYRELFNAIATAFSSTSYGYLSSIALCLAGTWAIIRFSVDRSIMGLAKWVGTYYAVFYVLMIPNVTINIIDRLNPGAAYAVDGVPFGLSAIAYFTSTIGDGLTQMTEKTFSLPDDLLYEKTGMVMASRLATASTQFQVTDPNFSQSLQSFVNQCVFYDLLLNKYTWNDLLNAPDIWGFVSGNASPARAFMYYQAGNSQVTTCKDGIGPLTQDWQNAVQDAASHYGAVLFPGATDAKATLLSYLPEAYNFLANVSTSGTSIMTQSLMMNALQDGVAQMGASTNSTAALEAYSFAKAQQQKRLTNYTVGDMAAYWLPIMQNVLQAALYGSFIFVLVLVLFPFGRSVLSGYIGSLVWLQLWAPMYAILNLFMNFYAQHVSSGLTGGLSGLTLLSQAGFAQANADVAGLAGYLSLSVPLLAAGVIKGMMGVFSTGAQYMAGVTQGAASGAASEAITGNLSLGNTNFSNHSSFNDSANHFDTNMRVSSGMSSVQMSGGSTLSMTPNGTEIMNNQSAISNLGTSVNLAESVRSVYSQQAEAAESTALSHARASMDAASSGVRSMYELGNHQGKSSASGESWTYSTSAAVSDAIADNHRLTEQFAHDHKIGFGESASVLGRAYAGASGGLNDSLLGKVAGVNAGVSGGYERGASNTDSTSNDSLYSSAQNYVRDTNFSQNVDVVSRAAQDHSIRSSSEEGSRLIDNMGASFDQSQSARNEMSNSLQKAESYRQSASMAEENAVSINSNASQAVYQELIKEGHSAQEIATKMAQDPAAAQEMVQHATDSYAQKLTESWGHGLPDSNAAVEEKFNTDNSQVASSDSVTSTYQQDHKTIEASASQKGLDISNQVDSDVRNKVDDLIIQNKQKVSGTISLVDSQGKNLADKVAAEQTKSRHGTTVRDLVTPSSIDNKDD